MAVLYSVLVNSVPGHLHHQMQVASERLEQHLDDKQQQKLTTLLQSSEVLAAQLARSITASEYLLESCCRYPDLLFYWLLVDTPYAALSASRIVEMVELTCCDCETSQELDQALRQLRRRLMVAIIWRDLNGLSDFTEVCQSMTAMAEACIQQALDFHYQALCVKHGLPTGRETGTPQQLFVLGMGKLGGGELNVSSDIDLIFAFAQSGETSHARPLDNQQFFSRLGQHLIKSLNEQTKDGFVFRVDMRLRPYGQSGALVSSFAALENYYASQGRDWERFAAIKARVVACSRLPNLEQSLVQQQQVTQQLYGILQPFTYRRYTDFSVIESLRKLKAMIVQEVRRKGVQDDVKLGAGGIRELEFIVQSFQLVYGGREPQLQQRHWLSVVEQLGEEGIFDTETVKCLSSAYVFLRRTEHAIQYYQDQQTQCLPGGESVQCILAWVMGFADWDSFKSRLDKHRQCVGTHFNQVIAEPDTLPEQQLGEQWRMVWALCAQADIPQESLDLLVSHGCVQPEAVLQQLVHLHGCWSVRRLSATVRESLDELIPTLLMRVLSGANQTSSDQTTGADSDVDIALIRLFIWLEKIVGRSSYITLLLENPSVLSHLAMLFKRSVWVADLLAQMPSLLDELLHDQDLYTLPSKFELQDELRVRLLRVELDVASGDIEAYMEVLRYFKLAHYLRVAASDLSGRIPLMQVSDYLTWIAEVVLEEVLYLAWQLLTYKHGVPDDLVDRAMDNEYRLAVPGFAIVAYGKLGGIELSYGSDLDLVFIYESSPTAMTNGKQSIDSQTFYTRLGQKIIHILNTRTLSGPLYEVDMRLRPSGNSGMLASSIGAFSRYQKTDAWVWEHQALVRARPITGDPALMTRVEDLRQEVLAQLRSLPELSEAVTDMRQKMRDHLGSAATQSHKSQKIAQSDHKNALFNLKQDVGGIVDIEFMVQYAVLAGANRQPELAQYTDNIRILQSLVSSHVGGNHLADDQQIGQLRIDAAMVDELIAIYKTYREVGHRLALQQQSSLLTSEQLEVQFAEYDLPQKRHQIEQWWHQWFWGNGS